MLLFVYLLEVELYVFIDDLVIFFVYVFVHFSVEYIFFYSKPFSGSIGSCLEFYIFFVTFPSSFSNLFHLIYLLCRSFFVFNL
jgi:hypothetical protein